MRQIKFRGKRFDNGEWVYGHYALDHQSDPTIIEFPPRSAFFRHKVIPETVGQFTGLLDKNGKEIYEGQEIDYYYKTQAIRGNVQWGKTSWCICFKTPSEHERLNRINPNAEIEVVENIHDK